VTAPISFQKKARPARRRVRVLGKEFVETVYKPSYAIGILCRDEAEQQALFTRVAAVAPGHDIKVLVI